MVFLIIRGLLFQSTKPQGLRLLIKCEICINQKFQSTKPQGLRLIFLRYSFAMFKFQSTKPQGLRPSSTVRCSALYTISIHEAARASTNYLESVEHNLWISIHEAARASTIMFCFRLEFVHISIHEAARASTAEEEVITDIVQFQSTKPQGLRQFWGLTFLCRR